MNMSITPAALHRRFHRQRGQALIYGILVLLGGLAALAFLFNTGQLTHEKTKLVNTADAVAYSAGIMHARALNFDAYANRALMANEVMIAQAVSISSWSTHIVEHAENVWTMYCDSYYSVPVWLGLAEYIPVCYALTYLGTAGGAANIDDRVQWTAEQTVKLSEAAKKLLKGAQANMALALVPARDALMQEVADANYRGKGAVKVDTIPITDNFVLFEGEPFLSAYSGARRERFKDAVMQSVSRDAFIQQRSWTSSNNIPCMVGPKAEFRRRGGTELIGMDEWKAMDTASLHQFVWTPHPLRPASCEDMEMPLGYGARIAADREGSDGAASYGGSRGDNPVASALAGNAKWGYSGLPTFYDLSAPALATTADKQPRLQFTIRLTRAKEQSRTSDGTAAVKQSGRLEIIDGRQKSGVLAAVATSEVYFERPTARDDGKTELASLFNPFWQTHLVSTSTADMAMAMALGGAR